MDTLPPLTCGLIYFRGSPFPQLLTSSSLAARKSTNYGICDGKVAKAEAAEERRAVTNLTTTQRYEVCSCARVGLFMCGFPTKRKWERGRDGRKGGKNYSYNSLITRRGRDNLICKNSTAAGMDASHFMIRRIPPTARPSAKRASCALMRVLSRHR